MVIQFKNLLAELMADLIIYMHLSQIKETIITYLSFVQTTNM